MAEMVRLPLVEKQARENDRYDNWWLRPIAQGVYLLFFVFYSVWAVAIDWVNFYKDDFGGAHFVSPFFNPDVEIEGLPPWFSPGFLFIWAPVGFRATCYYARKVYYRSFFWDPPACAVAEARATDGGYKGEGWGPLVINNFHRYFFYFAFILAIFHAFEFIRLIFTGGLLTWYGALGTLILGVDALFLSLYVLSCHSCKHIVGGGLNRSRGSAFRSARFSSWKFVKRLNERHATYFWLSLTTILLADLYLRFVLSRDLFGIFG